MFVLWIDVLVYWCNARQWMCKELLPSWINNDPCSLLFVWLARLTNLYLDIMVVSLHQWYFPNSTCKCDPVHRVSSNSVVVVMLDEKRTHTRRLGGEVGGSVFKVTLDRFQNQNVIALIVLTSQRKTTCWTQWHSGNCSVRHLSAFCFPCDQLCLLC